MNIHYIITSAIVVCVFGNSDNLAQAPYFFRNAVHGTFVELRYTIKVGEKLMNISFSLSDMQH